MSEGLKSIHVNRHTEFCEHLQALAVYLREHRLEVAACGDCGTPWITCTQCRLFYEFQGEEVSTTVPRGG